MLFEQELTKVNKTDINIYKIKKIPFNFIQYCGIFGCLGLKFYDISSISDPFSMSKFENNVLVCFLCYPFNIL